MSSIGSGTLVPPISVCGAEAPLPQNSKMDEWREYKLSDITSILGDGLHGTPKYDENGDYFFINGNNLSNGKIVIKNDTKRASQSEYEKYKKDLNDRTILVSINGTLGNIALYNGEKCILGKSACYFNVNSDVDTLFVKYVVTNRDFQEYIRNFATGTTIPNVSLKTMREYNFTLPPLEEQKAIAEVLSSLDDKIDLLHRQNKTLEELAQTLFRQWFIEGEETISYLFAELVDSISVKHSFNTDKVIFLNTSDVYDGKVLHNNYSIVSGLPGQAKKSIKKGDILFTEIRPANKRFAFIDFEADDYVVSTKLMVLRSKNVLDTSIVYLFLKQQDTLNYLQMLAESRSGTFPQITFDHLKTVEIFVPKDRDILESTTNIFKDLITKTFSNHATIKTLENMRDTLLPKLMSGEVRVNY